MGANDTSERLNYKITAEYTKAVLKDKPNFHVSFIMNVSPECDCWNHNDAAVVPDLGIAASFDPVALDKACADLVIHAPALQTVNRLTESRPHEHLEDTDKFRLMHPDVDWLAGLTHAEKIGIGNMQYELIECEVTFPPRRYSAIPQSNNFKIQLCYGNDCKTLFAELPTGQDLIGSRCCS